VSRTSAAIAVAALVVTAAALIVGVRSVSMATVVRTDRREVRDLLDAVAGEPARPIDGRLWGMDAWAPPLPASRGSHPAPVTPDVKIAAATLEQIALAQPTIEHQASVGLAHLVTGDAPAAVDRLEDAARAMTTNAAVQNDLATAYLARAVAASRPEDWASALAAANRARALQPDRPEPYFNRAVAFNGLRLATEEAAAWRDYLARERRDAWRHEAEARLRQVESRRSVATAPAESHQAIRERIEDVLFDEWASAVETGDEQGAAATLNTVEQLAVPLAAAGGDAMAADEVKSIRNYASRHDTRALAALAAGHRLFAVARRRFLADERLSASATMTEAAVAFRQADSPYAQWAPVFRSLSLRLSDAQGAIDVLGVVPLARLPARYPALRGRVAWAAAVAWDSLGRFDRGRELMAVAVASFRAAGEIENQISTETITVEEQTYLGDRAGAWSSLLSVMTALDRRGPGTRTLHFGLAATLALDAGLPEAAIEFQDSRVRVADTPRATAEAYLRRAETLAAIGRRGDALSDLGLAANAVAQITDPAVRDRNAADVAVARADVLRHQDCRQAVEQVETALPLVERASGTIRKARLLTIAGTCLRAVGDLDRARERLDAAIEAFETRRETIASAVERAQAFEDERAAFKELIAIEASSGRDAAAALRIAERARAGVVGEVWGVRRNPGADERLLPPGVALVYFESLPDRLLVWILTRNGRETLTRPIGAEELAARITGVLRAIDGGAGAAALRPFASSLVDEVIAPALAIADRLAGIGAPVFFVPDGPLFGLPFAALPDAQGHPLLNSRVIGTTPSLATFIAASARLTGLRATDVVAAGDGHDPAIIDLPVLPNADAEAAAVGRLYDRSVVLAGRAATRTSVFQARAAVVHFAGHTVLNDRYPWLSRMLFAPEPQDDSGVLLESDIGPAQTAGARVVVLATCEGAAGRPVEGEGAISVARAFFAAGVPAVIASLWPVPDDLQTLTLALHRELRATGDPARALRAGQLALLRERGAQTPVRLWGGFTMLGGTPGHEGGE
jgi:CHAT domain-containing protein